MYAFGSEIFSYSRIAIFKKSVSNGKLRTRKTFGITFPKSCLGLKMQGFCTRCKENRGDGEKFGIHLWEKFPVCDKCGAFVDLDGCEDDGDFETLTLSCGHSLNSHNGLGVCSKCWKKGCGKCLQLIDDQLLCPTCFANRIGGTK